MVSDLANNFIVAVDPDATSPDIQRAIYKGQHRCVDTDNWVDKAIDSTKAGQIVVKHQLAGNKGHYSVLCMAFIKLEMIGFPHSVHDQIVRHRDSSFNNMAFLVTSNRYTGDRFIDVADDPSIVQEHFYHRAEGTYTDRSGARFHITEEEREMFFSDCVKACETYAYLIRSKGYAKEVARDHLKFGYRQNFTIAGTVEALFHLWDQRLKKDSQLEIQLAASMMFDECFALMPELMAWYQRERYGRAILAP